MSAQGSFTFSQVNASKATAAISEKKGAGTITELIALAQKSRGWVFRDGWPPQRAQLSATCELIVLVPTLWRGRCRPGPTTTCAPIPFRRAG
jgi:hypothetical protein